VWGKKNASRVSMEKPKGNRLLAIPKCIFENNIKIHFKEIGWVGV
jgi:hypothetical protein